MFVLIAVCAMAFAVPAPQFFGNGGYGGYGNQGYGGYGMHFF